MLFDGNLGWRMRPNQAFGSGRQIGPDGYQSAIFFEDTPEWGLFSGSTGWSWGIDKEAETLHVGLAQTLKVNIKNFSGVSYNIFKTLIQMSLLHLEGRLPHYNIVYMGVCEAYTIAHGQHLSSNPRDDRVARTLRDFEDYYYNRIQWKSIFTAALKKIGNSIFTAKQTKRQADAFILDDDKFAALYEETIQVMKRINVFCEGRVLFVLEPSLYHKNLRTRAEIDILKANQAKHPLLGQAFSGLYTYIKKNAESLSLVDASSVVENDPREAYGDYCHPDAQTLDAVIRAINEKIQKR